MSTLSPRQPEHPIEPVFLDRWSPRAFAADAISEEDLLGLLEAARWAPSAYNSQPARFVYGRRGTPAFDKLLDLLVPANQSWAKDAAALVFVASNSLMRPPGQDKDVPSRSHTFDAGAAWMSFAIQAQMRGWYTHGMVGVDFERAFAELDVPQGYRLECAIALGRIGDPGSLPEKLQAREMPSGRRPLAEIALEGGFKR
ncbi:nitroreductase family protein [Lichenibacterium dinghuense]|uniref:nitroreductase family protein n=1 Tax=Lichenibacterium dinghuense TaxID=2895977 RepID=UPI001F20F0DA|nr:nitroreductase family protein [Lichenibacterium sp. 6Y81]